MPIISSIIAVLRIAEPDFVFSLPISCNASTVMLVDDEAITTPMKKLSKGVLPTAIPARKPPNIANVIPQDAIKTDGRSRLFSSLKSISIPAEKSRTITPSSAITVIVSFSPTKPRTEGPRTIPANNAPTTCGMCSRFVKMPQNFVKNRIIAKIKIMLVSIFPPPDTP
jgi:hypothetical protein